MSYFLGFIPLGRGSSAFGFRRASYRGKDARPGTARRAEQRLLSYASRLPRCREDLDKGWLRRIFG